MNWKEFFKPTRGKLIVSIIIPIIYWIFSSMGVVCKLCGEIKYESWPDIVSSCDCVAGSTFEVFIKDIIIVFVIPFFIIYLIYSTVSYLKHSR